MMKYRTLLRRIVAYLIDGLLMSPLLLLETFIVLPQTPTSWVIAWLIFFSLFATFYTILLHAIFGQTVGKMVMNVKLLDISEKNVSFWQAFLRDIFVVAYNFISCGMAVYEVSVSGVSENAAATETQQLFMNIFLGWQIINFTVLINSEKRRALHDFIAGTIVVRVNFEEKEEEEEEEIW